MAWCEACHRFLSPSTVRADGTCPTCGRGVEGRGTRANVTTEQEDVERQPTRLPWHLWVLAAAVAIYLGFRAWQGIEWVIQSL
jgi:PHP family Zn ribbon phosphoesterase